MTIDTSTPPLSTSTPHYSRGWQTVLTALIVIFVLLAQNPGVVGSWFSQPNTVLSLGVTASLSQTDWKSYVTRNVGGVANYAANIALQIENMRVNYGTPARFHIEVTQAGTGQPKSLYYELVIISPSSQVFVLLPLTAAIPPPDWANIANLGMLWGSNIYVPRQTLLSGKGDYYKGDYNNHTTLSTSYIWLSWDTPTDPTLTRLSLIHI